MLIFPVKSLDPVTVEEAVVARGAGLAGDREFCIVDDQGQWVNGKRTPLVHRIRSQVERNRREIALNGERFHLDRERPAIEAWLSRRLEIRVHLEQDAAVGFPDDTNASGPTLVSTATLCEVARWFGADLDEMRRRFRANLEIDGVPAFWEDQLIGVSFRLGEVAIEGVNPCARCAVPSRDSLTGEVVDPAFAKSFAERRAKALPPWADRRRF
ncbi:MAG: MOSC N-terminal beta barrel domain-containing protein, partial [Acidobacteria bacterium]|nr:MOSC N-terminal beta barrel domain-containing protein [Acidobacteriota bacterium]